MSVQTAGTDDMLTGAAQVGPAPPDRAPRALRILALAAVWLGLAALAAATFVLSYSAIRAVALQAGIEPRLARGYPLLLDAMLVIVLAAVLALRGAGLPSRLLAWLTLLVVLAAAAGAGAMHAAGRRLPHQAAAITAAVLPWVLVLIAFVLLLAMLRHARLRRTVGAAQPAQARIAPPGADPAVVHEAVVHEAVADEDVADEDVVDDQGFEADMRAPDELADESDLAPDDPSTDEGGSEPADAATPYPGDPAMAPDDGDAGPDDPDMPMFHRLWSSPTPPAG
jgi:Protein of unknown function (DUF2637)